MGYKYTTRLGRMAMIKSLENWILSVIHNRPHDQLATNSDYLKTRLDNLSDSAGLDIYKRKTDGNPIYASQNWIRTGQTFTQALSSLDQALIQVAVLQNNIIYRTEYITQYYGIDPTSWSVEASQEIQINPPSHHFFVMRPINLYQFPDGKILIVGYTYRMAFYGYKYDSQPAIFESTSLGGEWATSAINPYPSTQLFSTNIIGSSVTFGTLNNSLAASYNFSFNGYTGSQSVFTRTETGNTYKTTETVCTGRPPNRVCAPAEVNNPCSFGEHWELKAQYNTQPTEQHGDNPTPSIWGDLFKTSFVGLSGQMNCYLGLLSSPVSPPSTNKDVYSSSQIMQLYVMKTIFRNNAVFSETLYPVTPAFAPLHNFDVIFYDNQFICVFNLEGKLVLTRSVISEDLRAPGYAPIAGLSGVYDPSLAALGNGGLLLFYGKKNRIYVKLSKDKGYTWGDITWSCNGYYPKAVSLLNGNVGLTYITHLPGITGKLVLGYRELYLRYPIKYEL